MGKLLGNNTGNSNNFISKGGLNLKEKMLFCCSALEEKVKNLISSKNNCKLYY